jgi:hypothetical protein
MSLESDEKLILQTADKLVGHVGKLTQHDPHISVAALGVAMMCLAKADGITRAEINALIDIAERGLAECVT